MSPGLLNSQKLAVLLFLAATGNGLYAQTNRLSLSSSTLDFSVPDAKAAVPSQTVLVTSTEGPLAYDTEVGYVSTDTGWLSVSGGLAVSGGKDTPSKFVVNVAAAHLASGSYMGFVKLTSGSTESAFVTVMLNVGDQKATVFSDSTTTPGTTAAAPTITVTPSGDLTYALTINGPKVSKTVTVSSSVPGGFYIISGIGGWLSIPQDDFQTPAQVTFTADPTSFPNPTNLGGSITFVGFGGGLAGVTKTITASMALTAGTGGGGSGLSTNPSTSLVFSQTLGATAAPAQTVTISSGTATVFTASASSTPSGWLTVTPSSGTSPATVTVAVSSTGLTAGTYTGSVVITGGSTTINLPVTFTLQANPTSTVTATPSSLSFSQTVNGAVPATQTVILAGNTPTSFSATSNSTWLTFTTSTNSNSSATLTVGVNASGLTVGTYSGAITVITATTTLSLPVTLTVVTVAPTLTATPTTLSLSQILGGTPPGGQIVIDSLTPTTFTASSNASWLTVTPSNATTPATITAFVRQTLVAAGTYQASITVTGGTAPISIPVTLTLSGASISATPTALSFYQTLGTPTSAAQTLQINSSVPTTFSVGSNANWLNATPSTGSAPGTVTVSLNPTGLAAGAYQSTLTVSTAFTTFDVPVTLTVSPAASTITLQPESLTFTGTAGGAAPQAQTVFLTSPGSQFPYTVSASTVDRGPWLSVSPNTGKTPSSLTVSVNPTGLQTGQYTGAITITPTDPAVSTRVISVTLTLTGGSTSATVTVRSVVNAASMQPGPLAPGEIITIFGSGLGSAIGSGTSISGAGAIASVIGDTRILFDGIPAPLLYARADQINAIVPYGLHGRFSTNFQVEVVGVRSEQLQLRVETASPAIFTMAGSGKGQGAVLNQDGTVNSPIFPAPRDSIIAIYGTGEGQTRPAGQDGRIITTDVRPPLAPVSVKIGGIAAEVKYAGSAPGLVSGVFQLNISVPPNTPVGGQIPVEITIGGVLSQLGVTVAVK